MNIKGQSHSLTFVEGHSDSTCSNFFASETARPIEAKFHVEPKWNGGMKVCSNGPKRWPPCPYMVKNEKFFFSETKRLMTLKVCMQHQLLEYYQDCSNDDPGFTLTYFTARSNLVPYAFIWEKLKQWIFQRLL